MRRPEYITAWRYVVTERWPTWLVEKYTNTEAVPERMIGHYATAVDGEFWRWFEPERFEQMFVPINEPQTLTEIQNAGNEAVISDIPWAVNYLLEQIAAKFEAWETFDLFRSEAAATVRSFKHDLSSSVTRPHRGSPE